MQNRRDIEALTDLVRQMAERLTAAHERMVQTVTSLIQEDRSSLAALTEAQQRTDASLSTLTVKVAEIADGLNELRTQTATLTDGLNELRAQTATLTDGLNELRTQVAALTDAQQQTNNRMTEMNGRLTSLSGQVANLTGGRYEREVARLAPRYARRQLNLVNATITHTSWEPGNVVSAAVNSDDITDAEAEDLNRADLVITGGDTAGDTIHAIAEISVTVEPTDVIRSARRAVILRKATGQVVHAIAIGNDATLDAIALAESHNATILTVPAPAERD